MSSLTYPPLSAPRSQGRESAAAPAGGVSGLLWLTWRQHRWAILACLVIAAVLTGWMAYLAAELTTLHHQCHDMICPTNTPQSQTLHAPHGPRAVADFLLLVVRYVPVLSGVFIGVPLLTREHEQRTLLLAWSQDVSPLRWLWAKLALLGLFVAALTAAVAGVSDHLAHAVVAIGDHSMWDSTHFLASGMLPLTSGVGWFAVGVALGAAIRRTLPALLTAVAGFIGLTLYVQLHYITLLTPLSQFAPVGAPPLPGSATSLTINAGWSLGAGIESNLFDASGHELSYATLVRMCPGINTDHANFSCLDSLRVLVVYQPGSRIPVFHLILNFGYLGLAAVALLAVWLIVRRTNLRAG
ncbi:hypothetical protein GCM10023322_25520 [Rugosimonospora acidiphila]|uniref:ABC-2 family transporter protein n=1 Tax=Rugosimonospora acidiphila TaxID=556531 RepID=A0ABP9RQ86_9ACTN